METIESRSREGRKREQPGKGNYRNKDLGSEVCRTVYEGSRTSLPENRGIWFGPVRLTCL